MQSHPDDWEANYRLGEFYLHTGRIEHGIPWMQKAVALQPGNDVAGYDLALAYYDIRDYDHAQLQIEATLKHRDTADLHALLADVEESAGNYLKAAAEYQMAARLEPSEENIFNWASELIVHETYAPAITVLTRAADLYPRSLKINVALGTALYLDEQYDRAMEQLCAATDLAPSEPWPYLFLGATYAGLSSRVDGKEVKERLKRFASLEPANPKALYYYAFSLWDRDSSSEKDTAEAESLMKKTIALDPSFIDAHLQLGIMYADRRDYSNAVDQLSAAVKLNPNLATAHYHLAQAYTRVGRKELANQEFHAFQRLHNRESEDSRKERDRMAQFVVSMRNSNTPDEGDRAATPAASVAMVKALLVTGQTQRALSLAGNISGASPNDARVHFSLGIELAAARQYGPAIHEFELTNTLAPNTFEVLHNLGEAYLRSANPAAAEHCLEQALAVRPDSPATLLFLAQAEADQHKYIEAVNLSIRARNLQPDDPGPLLLLAQISMAEELDNNAVLILTNALKLAPDRPDLHAALGEGYLKLGMPQRAIAEFKRVLLLRPSAEALALIGEAFAQAGDIKNAKNYLEQALGQDPHNAASLYQLGLITGKEGRSADAEALFASAVKADPGYDNAMYELAIIKMREGKYAEAVPLLRDCAPTMNVPRIYYRLAIAERHLNDTAAADADMQKFKALSKLQQEQHAKIRDTIATLNWNLE